MSQISVLKQVVWLVSVYGCWAKKSPKNGLGSNSIVYYLTEDFVCLPTLLRLVTWPANIVVVLRPPCSLAQYLFMLLKSAKIPFSKYLYCKNIFISSAYFLFNKEQQWEQKNHFLIRQLFSCNNSARVSDESDFLCHLLESPKKWVQRGLTKTFLHFLEYQMP